MTPQPRPLPPARPLEVRPGAGGAVRAAGLPSAAGAWRHSLRFRLALTYSALALLMIMLVSASVVALLLSRMDQQFNARLNERADTLAEAFTGTGQGLGKTAGGPTSYTMLVKDGTVIYASPILREFDRSPFPFGEQSRVNIQDTTVRAVKRQAGDFGTLWVGLPEDDLIAARESALSALLVALVFTPLLLLLVGWWVGQRSLSGLERAATLADRIDPTHSLETLPLPVREDEVHRLLSALNRLLVRIEAGQAREKQLLGQIVHELGAPLTVLRASLARAGERTGDAEVMRAALVADELTFTTQDLMQLARGQLEIKLAWHYIPATTLRDRLDRLVPGTTFSGNWTVGILCDPDRLTQALRNLLANARRAAGPEGTVTLDLKDTPESLTFTVRDSGPGLPTELGERIFDPFVSGSGSSGLGLSVSRQIAAMHGGSLRGANHPQGGAQFVLTLPNAALTDEDEAF
ncbi:HAMP domain-containing histidine kinase [Deinococcus sp. KSM4-11]|uniref:sensor histidine kinase n=1 Tax=Deinococcus sp. KSM4-11 TaxID=2568654 RepID=UPI0010A2F6D0|nr:HAMP domain-containing sensor histidine kinase [Deinococcus sp. KSM4-11]THF85188.1 HAMP domain-containing histidine kinase [Deinococcus sp. KSM4-11]